MILLQAQMTDVQTAISWWGPSGLFSRLLIDIFFAALLIGVVYFRRYRHTDLFLTFFSFNIIIFLVAFLLNKVEMTMGAAFGIFAVFSMLRYRTENITAKDMTYVFILIALGMITAISPGEWYIAVSAATLIFLLVLLLETGWIVRHESSQKILYEKIELIHITRREELMTDLRNRTGLNIHRIRIEEIDLLRDATTITVFYY